MHDPSRADQQLLEENVLLKQRILALERADAEHRRTEEALRSSQELLGAILDSTSLLVYVKDVDGALTFVNRPFATLFGMPRTQLIGKTSHDLLGKAEADAHRSNDLVVMASRSAVTAEEATEGPDGRHTYLSTKFPVFDAAGTLKGVCGISADLTERTQAEAALRASEEQLSLVLEGSQLGFWDWNLETGIVQRDRRWAEMLGYSLPEIDPGVEHWTDLLHPDDRAAVTRSLEDHLDGLTPMHRIEYRLRAKDGQYRWILDQARIVKRNPQGAPLRMAGTHTDVTERKRAEATLRESEGRLRRAQRAARLGNWEWDLTTNEVYWAEENYRIHGIDPQHVSPSFDAIVGVVDPIERESISRSVADAVAGKSRFEIDYTVIRPDNGERRVVHSMADVIVDEGGKPVRMVGTVQDITDHKRAEDEKAQLEAQLQQAQKMESVGRLAGGVAHDFNNMLGVILGHAELALGQVDSTQPLHADLEEIREAARRSADLTRQLLAFARKQTVQPRVLDLNETVAGMLQMLRRLIGEHIDLRWQPCADLWPVKVDPSQIDQILANLCVNARDAITSVGTLTIGTGTCTLDKRYCAAHAGAIPGEYVRLTVSDDGCGMDEDTLSQVFEPFFTTKGVGKGTGLGLATVYGAVTQNNGFIDVVSQRDQGTTFTIYLPRQVGPAEQARTESAAWPARRGHETILLVEDEPAILAITKTLLERQGYTVLAASAPGQAIRLAEEHSGEIHLLMTDVIMPEMDGRILARTLLSVRPSLKRLFMSGYTADVIAHHGVLDDGVLFIQKPFSSDDLATKVRETLDRT